MLQPARPQSWSIPDLEGLGVPPRMAGGSGCKARFLSLGQSLQQTSLLRINLLEPGIKLGQAPHGAGALGGAPRPLQLQTSDLQVRPMGDRNQVHLSS